MRTHMVSTATICSIAKAATQSRLPSGVEEPRSGRLATADADLPSLSYGHLVGDSTGPASRG